MSFLKMGEKLVATWLSCPRRVCEREDDADGYAP